MASWLDAQRLDFLSMIQQIKNHFCPDQCREEVDGNAQAQRHGKPLDRPGAKEKQGDPGDQRRHV